MPHKRIIVCCDGTWNNSDGTGQVPTNVAKLARCIDPEEELPNSTHPLKDAGIKQVVYYQRGIGNGTGWVFGQLENAIEGATGRGVRENIMQAYQYICLNYQHGDEIFLVGYSRGAFTARSLAHVIYTMGLLTHRGLSQLGPIFDQWERQNEKEKEHGDLTEDPETKSYFRELLAKEWTRPDIPIKCLAVWDTVGALGMPRPFFLPQPVSKRLAFVNTKVLPNVEYAFHALALDERRRQFKPTLWEKPEGQELPKVLKQVWFPGSHSDVGGGNQDDAAARIPMAWMLSQLDGLLAFNPLAVGQFMRGAPGTKPSMMGRIHNSMRGLFLLGGEYARVPGSFTSMDPITRKHTGRRLVNTNESIHWTARARMKKGEYEKAGLVGFVLKCVATEPNSPIVHETNETKLPKPGPPGRRKAVQWVNKELRVALMEDEMREYEKKILQLWEMQDFYPVEMEEVFKDRNSGEVYPSTPTDLLQRLERGRKRSTAGAVEDEASKRDSGFEPSQSPRRQMTA